MPMQRYILLLGLALLPMQGLAVESLQSSAALAQPWGNATATVRATSMGSAFVAVADDASALVWNPAGLGSLRNAEIGLHHNAGLLDAYHETVLLGLPSVLGGGLGAAIHYGSYGSAEGRDAAGNAAGSYSLSDAGLSLGWGRQWRQGHYIGLALKGLRQSIGADSYDALAADLGLLWLPTEGLRLGLAYANLGSSVGGSAQASALRLGASYQSKISAESRLLLSLGGQFEPGGAGRLQLGAEGVIHGLLALRAGYQLGQVDPQLGGLNGLSCGLGLSFRNTALDYAYLPYGDLGASQRLSLSYQFGGQEPQAAMAAQQHELKEAGIEAAPNKDDSKELLLSLSSNTLKFDTGQSLLKPEGIALLDKLAAILKSHPQNRIRIEGHTDNEGTPEFNQRLSLARAEAAKQDLLSRGVPPECILSAEGFGDSQPVAINGSPEGKAQNRRVVFRISFQ